MTAEIALLTGCGSGIGRALALELHSKTLQYGSRQYKVYATDYREEPLQQLAELGISIAKMDVTSVANIQEVVGNILKEHGHIDLLVCNAGVATGGFLAEQDYDAIERMFDVNVHGIFRTIQAVAPHMMARRSGRIATMCSVMSWFAQPFQGAYTGSKGAVERMTESLAMELEPFGVSVTSVVPGWVKTELNANSVVDWDRYESPNSFYQPVIEVIRKGAARLSGRGMPTAQAVAAIAKGLAKKPPPRFLYTGQSVWEVMFHAIVQNSFLNVFAMHISIITNGLAPLWKHNAQKRKLMAEKPSEKPAPVANGKHLQTDLKKEKLVPLALRKEE